MITISLLFRLGHQKDIKQCQWRDEDKGEEKKATSEIEVIAGDGIGYVVPGKVSLDESLENITFKFRVRKPSKNVYIQYEQNGNVIKKVLKTAIIPSEMEIQKLARKQLVDESSPITIKMVAKEM